MSFIKSYYIIDEICLWVPVNTCDSGGANIKYSQISFTLSQRQLIAHTQYFVDLHFSVNLFEGYERLRDGGVHFKCVKLLQST